MRLTHFAFVATSALSMISARSIPVEGSDALVKRIQTDWNYHGCWTDEGDRQLGGASYHTDNMTPATCVAFCESKGYSFAGVEYARECFCGYNLRSQSVIKDDEECGMTCAGDADLKCGGPNRLNVYTSKTPTQIVTNPGPVGSGWTYKSCYEDSVYGRTLAHQVGTSGGNSVDACTSACKLAGYSIAGVEWGIECFCDNVLKYSRPNGLEGCDMVCDGNALEYCGGAQKLNVYMFEPLPSSSTVTTSVTSSTTPFASVTSTLSTSSSTTSSNLPSTVVASTTTTTSTIPSATTTSTTTSAIVTVSSSTLTTTTTTTSSATCTPTPIVSLEQQAKDTAALAFLQENNSILKMLTAISFKEFNNNTIGGPVLGPIYTAVRNWVPCTDQIALNTKQLACGSLTISRSFLACIIFRTSPAAQKKGPNAPIPESAITKLYNDRKNEIIPWTGEPLKDSDIDIVTYMARRWPATYNANGQMISQGGLQNSGSNVLYYYGELDRINAGGP